MIVFGLIFPVLDIVQKKVQRKEFRSVHWQKFLIASALRRIRCHHLYWGNSSWSLCTVSVNNVVNNFRLVVFVIFGRIWSINICSLFFGTIVQFTCKYKKTKQNKNTCLKTLSLQNFCYRTIQRTKKPVVTSPALVWHEKASRHVAIHLLF